MALVAERWGLIPELQSFTAAEKPVWGTCAGLIFLANRATGGRRLLVTRILARRRCGLDSKPTPTRQVACHIREVVR
jgi:glutamine amidotransferase PdxT